MKRRIYKRFPLLISCLLLLLAAAFSACTLQEDLSGGTQQPPAEVHLHTFGEWEVTPATCEEAGNKHRACTECGSVQSVQLPATGHNWQPQEGQLPTCTAAGFTEEKCQSCGETKKSELPAVGHSWEKQKEQLPTCTAAGYTEEKCQNCGETKKSELPAAGHSWGLVKELKAATCTQEGLRSAVCEVCGAHESEQIVPATGHTFGDWQREREPSCTEAGEKVRTCEVCFFQEREEISATGHTFGDWQREREPSCTEAGEKVRTCEVCFFQEKEEISATGHRYDEQFTVDIPPTAEHGGEQSRHCLNSGCNERIEVTPLDPLQSTTVYTVSLRTTAGEELHGGIPKIDLYDETGEIVAFRYTMNGEFTLPTKTYTVKVSGLPLGYHLAREQYELTPTAPSLVIGVPASMIASPAPTGNKYGLRSVLYDMEVDVVGLTAEQDQKTTLSAIFSQYKAVVLNVYFSTCSACVLEMPRFVAAYNATTPDGNIYGEEVACVMLSNFDFRETVRRFKNSTNCDLSYYPAARNIPMIMLYAPWLSNYLIKSGFIDLFPTTLLIDCESVIVEKSVGGMSSSSFVAMMQRGIDRYNTIQAWWEKENRGKEQEEITPAAAACDLAPAETTVKRRRS